MEEIRLDSSFYLQEATELAPALLGKYLQMDTVVIRILETEAYMPEDSACHASKGKTKRNAPMFDRGGFLYVYLCYGIHQMFNIVSGQKGSAQAVLIRAGEVFRGHDIVRERRRNLDLIGPGKLTQGLGVQRTLSGEQIGKNVQLWDAPAVLHSKHPRIGIDYALPKDRDALWRFVTPAKYPTKNVKKRKRSTGVSKD